MTNHGKFDSEPITQWISVHNTDHHRWMRLMQPLIYTDPNGKEWKAVQCAWINGATIPKFLWSTIGSPFTGKYRRASIVHDYFVGEGDNPDPADYRARRSADKMFYHACRADGCSYLQAVQLYLGVSIGSLASRRRIREKIQAQYKSDQVEDVFDIEIEKMFRLLELKYKYLSETETDFETLVNTLDGASDEDQQLFSF